MNCQPCIDILRQNYYQFSIYYKLVFKNFTLARIRLSDNIALLSVTTLSSIIILLIPHAQNIWAADDNDDNNDPNPGQLSGLRTCTIQEENIQGRTIIGTILADVCRGTQHSETLLGLQDNDVFEGH
jgi:hypothetical protein